MTTPDPAAPGLAAQPAFTPGLVIVDMTMPLSPGMPVYPGEPGVSFEQFTTIADDRVEMTTVHLFSQVGTHIDAPRHFVAGGGGVDEIDLRRCVGQAGVVRLRPLEAGTSISAGLLAEHEKILAAHQRVIFDTGWHARAGTPGYFRNWPTFERGAVDYLLRHGLLFVGLDTPSPGTDDTNADLHAALFRDELALVECLVNTHLLPATFELLCLPLPFVGLDGSPVRAVARYQDPVWQRKAR
jgi:arylformamidase